MGKHQFTEAERFTVYSTDAGKCFWCGLPLYYRDVQIDHCLPEYLEDRRDEFDKIRNNYGLSPEFQINGFDNWVTCHQGCNLRKVGTILPNAPATLFVFSQLQQRAPRLEAFREKFEQDIRRDRILTTLRTALNKGAIEREDVLELVGGLPDIPMAAPPGTESTIQLSEQWSIVVPGSPAAGMAARSWKVCEVSGNIAYVHNERFGGMVPNVARPDPSWQCSQCGSYGPWDGIICRNCGSREEPD